jgi:methyl-accepting chemotaxis protein
MITETAAATERQMSVSQKIAHNAVSISDVTKASENSIADVDKASSELKEAADHLASIVTDFKT